MNRLWIILLMGLVLSGCDESREGGAGGSAEPSLPWWSQIQPEEIVLAGAAAAAAIGVCLLFAAGVLLFFGRRKLAGIALGVGAILIIGAPIVAWVGRNLWWIGLCCGLAGAGAAVLWARAHVAWIEEKLGIDLDRDGKIGKRKVK